MQTVFVQDGVAHEVLPASEVPLDERYPAEFLAMCHEVSDQVQTGWTWDGKAFAAPVAPPAPVPQSVSIMQAVLALHATPGSAQGKTLLDDVEAAVAASSDPRIPLAWKRATALDRQGLFVKQLAVGLKLDDAKLDALFTAAAKITV